MRKKNMKAGFIAMGMILAASAVFGLDTYLTLENDSILGVGDHDYTHGSRIEAVSEGGWHYMVSQTMYAPDDLALTEHRHKDRPYCGMLLGGVGKEMRFGGKSSRWTHYGELDFGVVGPAAFCKETQKFVHKVLGCTEPMGWDDQLHNEVVVNGQWWAKYHWHPVSWAAVVPRAGCAAGTIQDFVEAGFDVKAGWNIQDTPNNEIVFSAPAGGRRALDRLSTYVYGGVGERFYLYNHVLEGSLFGHRDDDLDADIRRFVTEMRVGAVVRLGRLYASAYAVFRTDEYKGQRHAPDYGGVVVGWRW